MILTYHMVALILIDFLPWCQGMSTARLFGVLVRKFHTGCPATSGPRICSMMLSNLSLHHKFWNDWNEDILIVKIITLNTIKVLPYLRCCMRALYFWHFLWFKQKYIWSRVCFFQFGKSLEQPIFFKFFCNENLNWW